MEARKKGSCSLIPIHCIIIGFFCVTIALAGDLDTQCLQDYKTGIRTFATIGETLKPNPAIMAYQTENQRLRTIETPKLAHLFALPTYAIITQVFQDIEKNTKYQKTFEKFIATVALDGTYNAHKADTFRKTANDLIMESLKRQGVYFPSQPGNTTDFHTRFLQENSAISDTAVTYLIPGSFLLYYIQYVQRRAIAAKKITAVTESKG